jgi:hypothetical protein
MRELKNTEMFLCSRTCGIMMFWVGLPRFKPQPHYLSLGLIQTSFLSESQFTDIKGINNILPKVLLGGLSDILHACLDHKTLGKCYMLLWLLLLVQIAHTDHARTVHDTRWWWREGTAMVERLRHHTWHQIQGLVQDNTGTECAHKQTNKIPQCKLHQVLSLTSWVTLSMSWKLSTRILTLIAEECWNELHEITHVKPCFVSHKLLDKCKEHYEPKPEIVFIKWNSCLSDMQKYFAFS